MVELAREATKSFVDAQKKLLDVAGRQMTTNVKNAGKAMELLQFPSVPLAELTREGVQSYVNAQKALMEVMLKPAEVQKLVERDTWRLTEKGWKIKRMDVLKEESLLDGQKITMTPPRKK